MLHDAVEARGEIRARHVVQLQRAVREAQGIGQRRPVHEVGGGLRLEVRQVGGGERAAGGSGRIPFCTRIVFIGGWVDG